jgi:hypothetical protein
MIPAVEAMGGEIVECAVMVDRSGGLSSLASPSSLPPGKGGRARLR